MSLRGGVGQVLRTGSESHSSEVRNHPAFHSFHFGSVDVEKAGKADSLPESLDRIIKFLRSIGGMGN